MRYLLLAAAGLGAALALGSCATMNEEQCLAGDWSGQGYADGLGGLGMSRLDEHAQACAKHGVTPDAYAYRQGRDEGLRGYCTPQRGFRAGREGASYAGVCPASLEAAFLPAYNDGRQIYSADQAVNDARSRVTSRADRMEELDDRIRDKQAEMRAEGVTDEQRRAIEDRIRELRREREDTGRDWRRAQNELDDAEGWAREIRYRMQGSYGGW